MATAAAGGGFDREAQQLRAEIQAQLQLGRDGRPVRRPGREVHDIQRTLVQTGNMLAPHHVWIGPSRWSQHPELGVLNREDEKRECLNWLLADGATNISRDDLLLNLINGVHGEFKNNGRSNHGLSRKELVKRMLLDGCYIVYRFAKCRPSRPPSDNMGAAARESGARAGGGNMDLDPQGGQPRRVDPSYGRSLECRDTWCLVDNYVPYGVLDVINRQVYENQGQRQGTFGGASARILLDDWELYYYVPPSQRPVHPVDPRARVQSRQANCLLILLAELLKPRRPPPGAQQRRQCQWLRATEYVRDCNAQFIASPLDGEDDRRSVLDVTATVGRRYIDVKIPPLRIDHNTTKPLLRNLVELEQREPTRRPYVTAYCFFMYKIASTVEDVELLQKEGIIIAGENNPEDVTRFFQAVVQGAGAFDADYLFPIAEELQRRHFWNRWWFWLKQWTRIEVMSFITLFFIGVPTIIYKALSYSDK